MIMREHTSPTAKFNEIKRNQHLAATNAPLSTTRAHSPFPQRSQRTNIFFRNKSVPFFCNESSENFIQREDAYLCKQSICDYLHLAND